MNIVQFVSIIILSSVVYRTIVDFIIAIYTITFLVESRLKFQRLSVIIANLKIINNGKNFFTFSFTRFLLANKCTNKYFSKREAYRTSTLFYIIIWRSPRSFFMYK